MSPASFWFYICSHYFPYYSNAFSDYEEIIHEVYDHIIESFSKPKMKKNIISNKGSFLNDIIGVINPSKNFKENEDLEDELKESKLQVNEVEEK